VAEGRFRIRAQTKELLPAVSESPMGLQTSRARQAIADIEEDHRTDASTFADKTHEVNWGCGKPSLPERKTGGQDRRGKSDEVEWARRNNPLGNKIIFAGGRTHKVSKEKEKYALPAHWSGDGINALEHQARKLVPAHRASAKKKGNDALQPEIVTELKSTDHKVGEGRLTSCAQGEDKCREGQAKS